MWELIPSPKKLKRKFKKIYILWDFAILRRSMCYVKDKKANWVESRVGLNLALG